MIVIIIVILGVVVDVVCRKKPCPVAVWLLLDASQLADALCPLWPLPVAALLSLRQMLPRPLALHKLWAVLFG